MEFCCIRSLSLLLLTPRLLSGGSTLVPMSGNCRYFSSSVFAYSKCNLVHYNSQNHEDFGGSILSWPLQFLIEWFASMSAHVGKLSVMQLSRYAHWRNVDPGLVKCPMGDWNRQSCRATCQKVALSTQWIVHSWNCRLHWLGFILCFLP